jgi:hypothetical protein
MMTFSRLPMEVPASAKTTTLQSLVVGLCLDAAMHLLYAVEEAG